MYLVAEVCTLPRFSSLPLEIVEMIEKYSESALIWRYASVIELVERVSMTDDDYGTLNAIPVSCITSWTRGSPPLLARPSCSNDETSIIRITMDSHGVSNIGRLPGSPPSSLLGSDYLAYIVEPVVSLKGMTVDFKVRDTLI